VAVARDGEIIWEQGFGWADREERWRASEHTMYSLASISKPITATGLMVLVERGDLDLDEPVNRYLGRNPLTVRVGDHQLATVRRLANHTSGLPLHYQFFYEDEDRSRPPFAESLRRYGVLMFEPGERYQYSNFGYGILDYLIEQKSGMSYADFMRTEVFLLLGLTRTSVGLPANLRKHAATRYANDESPLPFYDFDHPGASAVFSSAHDLVRFGMFHLKHVGSDQQRILSSRSIEQMQLPTADTGGDRKYGIGWFVDEDEHGYRTISHTGGMGGVRTRLTLLPDEDIAVVALCNTNSDLPLEITREILGVLLPKYEESRLKSQHAHRPNDHPPLPQGPPELIGYWDGEVTTYQGVKQIELWAHANGDVHVRLGGQLRTLLSNSRLKDAMLTGTFQGDVGTDDANRRPYHLHLAARLRGKTLAGSLTAISLPGRKPGNALAYWVELRRKDTDAHVASLFDGHTLRGWDVIDESDFAQHGTVFVRDRQIVLDAGQPATGITYTGTPPRRDYEVSLDARRIAGSDFFCGLTFPVGPDYLTLIIGGWGGGVTGVSSLNSMSAVENETTGYTEFEQGRWYRIRLRVADDRVQAWIDDDPIVDVPTKDYKLSIWWEQEPARPLGITTWNTKAALRDIRLKRLDDPRVSE